MNVEYKDIEGFPGYKIGNDGSILSNKRSKGYINSSKGAAGYMLAVLYKDGKRHTIQVHKLVATHFVPNPNNYECINHKDENKLNNCYTNLEWCTRSYNRKYGTCEDRRRNTLFSRTGIMQFDLDGNHIATFNNCTEAAKSLGLDGKSAFAIGQCALGHYKTSFGYIWKRVQDESYLNNGENADIKDVVKDIHNKLFPVFGFHKKSLEQEYKKLKEENEKWKGEHNGRDNDSLIMKMWAISAPFTALEILYKLY